MSDAAPSTTISLFALLRERLQDRLPPIRCSKATLVDVSHTIEDTILRYRLPALFFTGFQESSHWKAEVERYKELSSFAQQLCIFAGGEPTPDMNERHLHITLRGDDPLRQEWFVLALTEQFSVLLCGQDRQETAPTERYRAFNTLWTFEPALISEVVDLLVQTVEAYRPERVAALEEARRNFPPREPSARFVTLLTAQIISHLENRHRDILSGQQAIQFALDQALELGAMKSQLVATISHELRTPLTAILGYATMLTEGLYGPLGPDQPEAIETISRQGRMLLALINDVLDFSKLDANRMELSPTPLALTALLESSLAPFRTQASAKNLWLAGSVIEPAPSHILADELRLIQIITNLVSNAVKYTQRGGVTLRLSTAAALDARGPAGQQPALVIEVTDTGIGIPEDEQALVFEDFYRLQGQQMRLARGTGLGLAIVQKLVTLMRGRIVLKSEVGLGSTFTVYLPLAVAPEEA